MNTKKARGRRGWTDSDGCCKGDPASTGAARAHRQPTQPPINHNSSQRLIYFLVPQPSVWAIQRGDKVLQIAHNGKSSKKND